MEVAKSPKPGGWGALRKRILPSISSIKRKLSNPFVRNGSKTTEGGRGSKKGSKKGSSFFGRGRGSNNEGYTGNPAKLDCPMHRCAANGDRGCLCPENNIDRQKTTMHMMEAVNSLMLFQRTASVAGESDIE